MMDLAKLNIAISEATEFLKMAKDLQPKLHRYGYLVALDDLIGAKCKARYPIDECAKVRAKSLDLYQSLIDLRRKEGDRNVSLRETPC